jgi:hypothetical protein
VWRRLDTSIDAKHIAQQIFFHDLVRRDCGNDPTVLQDDQLVAGTWLRG